MKIFARKIRKNKYNNIPITWNGRTYPSKKQCERAKVLHGLQQSGAISLLQEEVVFKLVVNNMPVCSVRLDFVYTLKDGTYVYEDVKGVFTPVQRVKYKLFAAIYKQKILLT